MSDFSFPWSKKKTPQELAKEAKRETKYVLLGVLPGIYVSFLLPLSCFLFLAIPCTTSHEQISHPITCHVLLMSPKQSYNPSYETAIADAMFGAPSGIWTERCGNWIGRRSRCWRKSNRGPNNLAWRETIRPSNRWPNSWFKSANRERR